LMSRTPRLRFPGKLPDGIRPVKLHLERHLIHMVADEFFSTLADQKRRLSNPSVGKNTLRAGSSQRLWSLLGHLDGIDRFALQPTAL
ncbi:MAG: hypothetical protein WB818_02065, partial [Desulfobacterales bacterium]